MIEHIEIITEGFPLMDKKVRLMRIEGYERMEGAECTITGKYAFDEYYYLKSKTGRVIVAQKNQFLVL